MERRSGERERARPGWVGRDRYMCADAVTLSIGMSAVDGQRTDPGLRQLEVRICGSRLASCPGCEPDDLEQSPDTVTDSEKCVEILVSGTRMSRDMARVVRAASDARTR